MAVIEEESEKENQNVNTPYSKTSILHLHQRKVSTRHAKLETHRHNIKTQMRHLRQATTHNAQRATQIDRPTGQPGADPG